MKKINWKKEIFNFLIAWASGAFVTMIVSAIYGEIPSIADFIGFGGILFFSALIIIPICYHPLLWLSKKLNLPYQIWLNVPLIALIGNIPLYAILYHQYQETMPLSEARIFLYGFVTLALVWSLINLKNDKI